jgi:hypothetical protein
VFLITVLAVEKEAPIETTKRLIKAAIAIIFKNSLIFGNRFPCFILLSCLVIKFALL